MTGVATYNIAGRAVGCHWVRDPFLSHFEGFGSEQIN